MPRDCGSLLVDFVLRWMIANALLIDCIESWKRKPADVGFPILFTGAGTSGTAADVDVTGAGAGRSRPSRAADR
jgi:hypothetical protein